MRQEGEIKRHGDVSYFKKLISGWRKSPIVPRTHTVTKTHKKILSMTMATYFQSSSTCRCKSGNNISNVWQWKKYKMKVLLGSRKYTVCEDTVFDCNIQQYWSYAVWICVLFDQPHRIRASHAKMLLRGLAWRMSCGYSTGFKERSEVSKKKKPEMKGPTISTASRLWRRQT